MFTSTAKNTMLDALPAVFVSAHTAYPGAAGSNEASGGSPAYARKAITLAPASGGAKAASTNPAIDVPAGTYGWHCLWDAATAGNCLFVVPTGGSPKTAFTVDVTGDKILCPAHGYADGDTVVIYGGGTAPGGLTLGTTYYVVNATTDDFQVAATAGGAAIDLTSAGSGELFLSAISPLTFAAQGVISVTSLAMTLNL